VLVLKIDQKLEACEIAVLNSLATLDKFLICLQDFVHQIDWLAAIAGIRF
jgi:hypothetical protein